MKTCLCKIIGKRCGRKVAFQHKIVQGAGKQQWELTLYVGLCERCSKLQDHYGAKVSQLLVYAQEPLRTHGSQEKARGKNHRLRGTPFEKERRETRSVLPRVRHHHPPRRVT